jgi:hypothetical protein
MIPVIIFEDIKIYTQTNVHAHKYIFIQYNLCYHKVKQEGLLQKHGQTKFSGINENIQQIKVLLIMG